MASQDSDVTQVMNMAHALFAVPEIQQNLAREQAQQVARDMRRVVDDFVQTQLFQDLPKTPFVEQIRELQREMLMCRQWADTLKKKDISPALRALGEEYMASQSTKDLLSQLDPEDRRELLGKKRKRNR